MRRLRMVDPAGFVVDVALSVYDSEALATIAKKLEQGFLCIDDCDMEEVERRRAAHAERTQRYARLMGMEAAIGD